MRHRLNSAPHSALVEHVSVPGIERDVSNSWPYMLQAHIAHVLMLRATRIVQHDVADVLLSGLLELTENGATTLDRDPNIEDVYFNVEQHLSRQLGANIAGWLQTGRSRNDHLACVARLWARQELVTAVEGACALRADILRLAERHASTVMTGYTHQQPSQPITFGHYLLGVEAGLERDTKRLMDAWPRVNSSPLGAGSMAGVSWPVDRGFLADLLGFDTILSNSVDAVATRDFALEVVSGLTSLALTLSRLATDLQQFVTWEFGGMQIADDVAAVSSVMPQKKNPVAFEHCKGAAAQVVGAWTAMAVAVKSTPYSHQRETSVESMRPFPEAVNQTRKSVSLMRASLEGLSVNEKALESAAATNFSTATDLADSLVRDTGLTFREAHGVVGACVRLTLQRGQTLSDLSEPELQQVTKELTGKEVIFPRDKLLTILNPVSSVATRSVMGGPARTSVNAQLEQAGKTLHHDGNWVESRKEHLRSVQDRLKTRALRRSLLEGEKQ